MRTSTTEPAPAARGFTLVEVLVVVLIVAVLVSLVAVRLASGARQTLQEEAQRLAALLAHARDEAIVTGAPLAWQGADAGYRFLQRGPDRTWQPVAGDASLRARSLPPGVRLVAIETPATAGRGAPTIVLAPTGVAEPFRITLASGEQRARVASDGVAAPSVEAAGN
jgi:general secretion pathway protein H